MKDFLKEGDIFMLGLGHTVCTELPEHFIYSNKIGVFDKLAETDIGVGEFLSGLDANFLIGKYVVVKTATDGGGTGHGPHDVYPDGHHVWAVNTEFENIKVNFYQSGYFTAVNKPESIDVVGKAKIKWVVDGN